MMAAYAPTTSKRPPSEPSKDLPYSWITKAHSLDAMHQSSLFMMCSCWCIYVHDYTFAECMYVVYVCTYVTYGHQNGDVIAHPLLLCCVY